MLFYVNKNAQNDGYHEVHKDGCSRLPDVSNRIYLGSFNSCKDALIEARKHYTLVDGCAYCIPDCHTR